MMCPKCNASEVWENAEKVAGGWRGPLRKCKDKNCGWIQWPPKPKNEPKAEAKAVHSTNGHAAKWTWASLSTTYQRSLTVAVKHVTALAASHKMPVTMDNILAACATVFIAASRDGVQDPKPAPEPPIPDDDPEYGP